MGQHKFYLRQKENGSAFSANGDGSPVASTPANGTRTDAPLGAGTTLMARLEHLERQNRRTRVVLGALLALSAYLAFSALAPGQLVVEKTRLESQELKLTDASGTTRLFLRMYSDAPVLQLMDSRGEPRLSLGVRFDDRPFISLSDGEGRTRASMGMTEADQPAIRLYDANGAPSFQIN